MKLYHIVFFLIVGFLSCDLAESCCEDSTAPEDDNPIYFASQIYPDDQSEGASRSPLFIWDGKLEHDDDGSYEFEVIVSTEDYSIVWNVDAESDTTVQFPDTLDAGTHYMWVVRTTASGDRAARSLVDGFTTGTGFNNPPIRPKVVSPSHNSTDIPLDAVFSWYSFDPEGDDLTYDFWYRREQDTDSILITGLTIDEYGAMLEADTRYYWSVTAFDEHGASAPMLHNPYFSTISTLPPHTPYPQDGDSDVPRNVTLSWLCSDPDGDALTYDVSMGLAGGTLAIFATDLSNPEIGVTDLDYNTDYDWSVTAKDDDGHSTHGPIWTFRTEIDQGADNGIYAELMIHRSQYISKGIPPDPDERIVLDHVYARFDSLYAPGGPLTPKKPPAVTYFVGGEVTLWWDDAASRYYRNNPISGSFLAPGHDYTFTVTEGDGVPALTKMIHYPECRPFLVTPDAFSFVPRDGFEVTWSGHDMYDDCPTTVRVRIMDMGPIEWTDIDLMVPNNGSYTFTEGDLSVLDPMAYQIQVVLIIETKEYIDEPGYDPRSWAWARTHATLFLYLQ